jgi:rubrerythrin
MNRTGMQMSPRDGERLKRNVSESPPDFPGDEMDMAQLRSERVAEADTIGSVPLPGTVKGAARAAGRKLAGKSPGVLIDKLGERLAFERTGTRLYEALIAKAEALPDTPKDLLDDLRRFHGEELRHFRLAVTCMEQLGADPTAQTPCADAAGVASAGLMQLITDPRTDMAQSLNALLAAELIDNAGWELLITLSRSMGHEEMAETFEKALAEEQVHLETIRGRLSHEISAQAA